MACAAELLPPHQAKPRPGRVDRTHLVVDEPEREGELAHHVLGHVGRNLRRLLRPGDPAAAIREHGPAERVDPTLELRAARHEEDDDISRTQPRRRHHTVRKRGDELGCVARIAEDHDVVALTDSELAG